jgi:hypothetical protein
MMRRTTLLIVLIIASYPALSCKCISVSFEKEVARSTKIFAGKLIGRQDQTYTFLILKSWKGVHTMDTPQLTLPQEDGCHRYIPEKMTYYVIFAEDEGIYNCSSSGFYDDSRIVDILDEWCRNTAWVNKKYEEELNRIEHDRKYLIHTAQGQLNTEGKRIILTTGKYVSELTMPVPLGEQGILLIIIATKAELTACHLPPDYILYRAENYCPECFSEQKKQKIIKRTMRKLNRNIL